MTKEVELPPEVADPLDAVMDDDRAWFAAHPHRRYRLRPTAIGELLPGQAMRPGSYTVAVRLAAGVRFRLPLCRPPAHLRRDTDRCCREIVARLPYRLNGRPVAEALARFRASLEGAMAE